MLSPIFLPDLRVGSSAFDTVPRPYEERAVIRRGAPQRLRFGPEPLGAHRVEPVALVAPDPLRIGLPSRRRVRLGLALMALGRRLAGPRASAAAGLPARP